MVMPVGGVVMHSCNSCDGERAWSEMLQSR